MQLDTTREALVLIGPPARDRLIFILKEGHLHRRQDAAYVLGMMKDPVAVPQLCVAMHNPDPLLRMIIVEALGKIGDPGGRRHAAQGPGRRGPLGRRRGAQVAQADGRASRQQVRSAPDSRQCAGVIGRG